MTTEEKLLKHLESLKPINTPLSGYDAEYDVHYAVELPKTNNTMKEVGIYYFLMRAGLMDRNDEVKDAAKEYIGKLNNGFFVFIDTLYKCKEHAILATKELMGYR